MDDKPIFTDEEIDKCRVALVDSMRWHLPLRFALAALNMSEEAYNRVKKIDNV